MFSASVIVIAVVVIALATLNFIAARRRAAERKRLLDRYEKYREKYSESSMAFMRACVYHNTLDLDKDHLTHLLEMKEVYEIRKAECERLEKMVEDFR